jgi:hypothetical protein
MPHLERLRPLHRHRIGHFDGLRHYVRPWRRRLRLRLRQQVFAPFSTVALAAALARATAAAAAAAALANCAKLDHLGGLPRQLVESVR